MKLTDLVARVASWRDAGETPAQIKHRIRGLAAEDQMELLAEIAVERLLRDSGGKTLPPEHEAVKDVIWGWVAPTAEDRYSVLHAWIHVPEESVLAGNDDFGHEGRYVTPDKLVRLPDLFPRALAWKRRQVAEVQSEIDELMHLWANRDDAEFLQDLADAEPEYDESVPEQEAVRKG